MNDDLLVLLSLLCSGFALSLMLWSLSEQRSWTKGAKKRKAYVKYGTAIHEAGHAMTVLRSNRAEAVLETVTTVPDEGSGGLVRFSVTGFPAFVQWEQTIIALGGAAGEHVGRAEISAHSCSKDLADALSYANKIAAAHAIDTVVPVVDMGKYYSETISERARAVLNFCFNEAHRRVKENERDFFRLVNGLLERRELTGAQVTQLLSSKEN